MSERLTPANVAQMIGITEETLIKWRRAGRGPAFYRLARGNTYYDAADVERWIEEQKHMPSGLTPPRIPFQSTAPVRTLPARFNGKRLGKLG